MGKITRRVSLAEAKSGWPALVEELESGRVDRIVVERAANGEAGASTLPPLWGAMRGSGVIAAGVDLTDPVLDEADIELDSRNL